MQIRQSNTVFMGNTPAVYDRQDQTLIINRDLWPNLTERQKQAIVIHEIGHQQAGRGEIQADGYAMDLWEKLGGDPWEYFSIIEGFVQDIPSQRERLVELGARAAHYEDMQNNVEMPKKTIRMARKHLAESTDILTDARDSFKPPSYFVELAKQRLELQKKAIESGGTSYILDPIAALYHELILGDMSVEEYNQQIKEANTVKSNNPLDTAPKKGDTPSGSLITAGMNWGNLVAGLGAVILIGALLYMAIKNPKLKLG